MPRAVDRTSAGGFDSHSGWPSSREAVLPSASFFCTKGESSSLVVVREFMLVFSFLAVLFRRAIRLRAESSFNRQRTARWDCMSSLVTKTR